MNMVYLPDELLNDLNNTSKSFKKKSGRHILKNQDLIYSAFSVRGYAVPRQLAQRDAQTRIKQFGLHSDDWNDVTVLDLGCNNGAMLFHLTNYGISGGLGIEFDADKVAVANRVLNFVGLENLTFRQGDIDKLDANELGQYDVVLALAIEAHVSNSEHLFSLFGKVTSKILCFEGNSKCDIEATLEKLFSLGFSKVEYRGFCLDDTVSANNVRPVFVAWRH